MIHIQAQERSFQQVAQGVEIAVLRRSEDGGLTFLVRMAKGALAPRHTHAGGEETFVIQGRLRIQHRTGREGESSPDLVVSTGDYCFVPPGEDHDGVAEDDALFLVEAPGGVAPSAPRAVRA